VLLPGGDKHVQDKIPTDSHLPAHARFVASNPLTSYHLS
jgi:hypothetical protein